MLRLMGKAPGALALCCKWWLMAVRRNLASSLRVCTIVKMDITGERGAPFKRLISQSIGYGAVIDAEGNRAHALFSACPISE